MNTFEITIERKSGEAWPVVAEETISGALLPLRAEGSLQFDPTVGSPGTELEFAL